MCQRKSNLSFWLRVGSGSGRSRGEVGHYRGGVGHGLGGLPDWKVPCKKLCEVVWGTGDQQGLRKILELFRKSLRHVPWRARRIQILEYTSPEEVAVCNLASVALPAFASCEGKE